MMNIRKFVEKQSKLIVSSSSTRATRLDLTKKNIRGSAILHFIPDTTGLPMLTAKGCYEVHQTEEYDYQGEKRKRYPTYTIPNPQNYGYIEGAVKPTEMQIKKLDKLCNLLAKYAEYTNPYSKHGVAFDSKDTDTSLWVKYAGTHTKFWAKVAMIKPATPSENQKEMDFSKPVVCVHNSKAFVKAFNDYATPDEDSEIPVEEQLEKIESVFSNDTNAEALPCVKIETKKGDARFEVSIKNVKLDKYNVQVTENDVKAVSPLNQEDWDFTIFDDNKVDTLIERIEAIFEKFKDSIEEFEDNLSNESEEEEEEENGEENSESGEESSEEEGNDNPFADDSDESESESDSDEDEEEEEEKPSKKASKDEDEDDED